MSQNRQKGICNKAGFIKMWDHHYFRGCCSNCANAPYFVSVTSSPLFFRVSHFLFFRIHSYPESLLQKFGAVTVPCSFSTLSSVTGLCGVPLLLILQMALWWGSRDYAEKEVLFAHTRQAALSHNTNCGRPTLLTSPPLGICCQTLFHFYTNHL